MSLVLKATDYTAAGSTDTYLTAPLHYRKDEHGQEICVVKVGDDEEVGVMMGWERPISEFRPIAYMAVAEIWQSKVRETVKKLCSDHENFQDGLKVLNVGFGLGIVSSTMFPCKLRLLTDFHL